jgi:hypothetical protein
VPIVSLPLFILFQWNYKKAVKAGLMPADKLKRSFGQSVKYYLVQFDAVGLLLLVAGLTLLLLPFNIYSFQPQAFGYPMIISMICFGVAFLIGFACWEDLALRSLLFRSICSETAPCSAPTC